MKSRAFTLIELLVVVAIIALLIAILLPALGRARELSNRAYCAANLRGVVQAMNIYAAENGTFPLIRPVPGPWAYCFYYVQGYAQSITATNPEAAIYDIIVTGNSGYGLNQASISGNWWLLILRNQISAKSLICKSDPVAARAKTLVLQDPLTKIYKTDFQAPEQYSYSCAYPYNSAAAIAPNGAPIGGWWKNVLDPSLPIMADMAPMNGTGANPTIATVQPSSPSDPKVWNSNNHERAGQNVAFSDAHVEFCRRPDVGQNNDNIWTHNNNAGPAQYGGKAVDPNDPSSQQVLGYGSSGPPYDIVMVPVRSLTDGKTH